MKLDTERLVITSWHAASDDDLAALFEPEVVAALPPNYTGVTAPRAFLQDREEEAVLYGIWHLQRCIGLVFVFEDGTEGRIGYLLRKSAWGQGFGKEVVAALVAHLKEGPMTTLYAGVETDNIGSIKVLEYSGFKEIPSDQEGLKNYRLTL